MENFAALEYSSAPCFGFLPALLPFTKIIHFFWGLSIYAIFTDFGFLIS